MTTAQQFNISYNRLVPQYSRAEALVNENVRNYLRFVCGIIKLYISIVIIQFYKMLTLIPISWNITTFLLLNPNIRPAKECWKKKMYHNNFKQGLRFENSKIFPFGPLFYHQQVISYQTKATIQLKSLYNTLYINISIKV